MAAWLDKSTHLLSQQYSGAKSSPDRDSFKGHQVGANTGSFKLVLRNRYRLFRFPGSPIGGPRVPSIIYPETTTGISIIHFALGTVATLRIGKLAQWLSSDPGDTVQFLDPEHTMPSPSSLQENATVQSNANPALSMQALFVASEQSGNSPNPATSPSRLTVSTNHVYNNDLTSPSPRGRSPIITISRTSRGAWARMRPTVASTQWRISEAGSASPV